MKQSVHKHYVESEEGMLHSENHHCSEMENCTAEPESQDNLSTSSDSCGDGESETQSEQGEIVSNSDSYMDLKELSNREPQAENNEQGEHADQSAYSDLKNLSNRSQQLNAEQSSDPYSSLNQLSNRHSGTQKENSETVLSPPTILQNLLLNEREKELQKKFTKKVIQGERPPIPSRYNKLAKKYLHLMNRCWHINPKKRPSFSQCREELLKIQQLTSDLQTALESDKYNAKAAQQLLKAGADLCMSDPETGWNPLQTAVRYGRLKMVEELLKMGMSVDCTDNRGRDLFSLIRRDDVDQNSLTQLLEDELKKLDPEWLNSPTLAHRAVQLRQEMPILFGLGKVWERAN